jgi:hypothetical protein
MSVDDSMKTVTETHKSSIFSIDIKKFMDFNLFLMCDDVRQIAHFYSHISFSRAVQLPRNILFLDNSKDSISEH